MKRSIYLLVFVSGLTFILTACGGTGELTISDPWSRPALAGSNGAIYFVIENNSGMDDVLLSVETDIVEAAEIHKVVMVDPNASEHEEDMSEMAADDMIMKMVPQENVPVADGETIVFEPGSYHVMLIGLTYELQEGDVISVTLLFENAGAIIVEAVVEIK